MNETSTTEAWCDWLATINYGIDFRMSDTNPPCTLDDLAAAYARKHPEEDADTWAWCITQETGVLASPPAHLH